MRIGLITPDPGHPLLAAATALLTSSGGHRVEVLDPAAAPDGTPADVYLLKSRTPRALALARELESRGARVVNSAAATGRCQDRTAMARDALRAGLPFAPTRSYASGAELALGEAASAGPVVVKSRHSRKGDVVVRLDSASRIRDFAAGAAHEPYVVQDFVRNPGWDHKLWAVGPHLFAAVRRSELSPHAPGGGPVPLAELPPAWPALVRRVGEVFGLDVYGVDVIDGGGGDALIIDVNAFPGIRNQPGAPDALAEFALRAGREALR
ncbi:ATP-grasp domain-containing protein [Streptomyces sp. IBSBF 2435]|uniref:ATP-grasp domain-containing protein n=1 Tax=Streptomyces sp. IBSBF 2435 TaxID=2903531 RepID=UPI002FDBF791